MSGTVGIIADMAGRYTTFSRALINLRAPTNTAIDWEIGADRGRSRNNLVQRSLDRGSEWILFLDDDHTFSPDLLLGLLAHDQPVVASLYLQRTDPFLPIAYTSKKDGFYWPLDIGAQDPHGLVPVVGAGTGGMLIRSEVFHELPAPWFVHTTEQSEDLYFCLLPGTWVDGGENRMIEDVALGDLVLTHNGDYAPVDFVYERNYEGVITVINPFYQDSMRMTPNHPLLVKRDEELVWVSAEDIVAGDHLCAPKPTLTAEAPVDLDVLALVANASVEDDGRVGYARTRKSALKLSSRIRVTPDLARLLGYFLAEGHVSRGEQVVQLCFGSHEGAYVDDACDLLRDLFGAVPTVRTIAGCTRVTVCSSVLSRLLTAVCDGRLSKERRLPKGWRSFDPETLASMIKGYWRGDGSYSKSQGFRMTTSSPRMAVDLRSALLHLGVYAGVRYRDNGSAGRYDVRVPQHQTEMFADLIDEDVGPHIQSTNPPCVTEDDDYFYVKVKSVSTEEYSGTVHNISVVGEHSYTVSSFASHNCDRVVEAGIPMFVDLDSRLGHLAVFNIFPVYDEQWAAGISVSPSMNVVLPIVMPDLSEA